MRQLRGPRSEETTVVSARHRGYVNGEIVEIHNVTEIQSWLSSKDLGAFREALEPLVQACHLLQSRKDESNIDTLCGEMTSKLKPRQVCTIFLRNRCNSTTLRASDDFEERDVDAELLAMVQQRLMSVLSLMERLLKIR
ncbi:hypothetical protein KIN20_010956 [Parelaphostrongylus tenuis]|nr:hypothetical protein KIN20_010956 [Parelaphostrongylus tenuis]